MSFYLDLSEFLINPITTGIQRIAGEICRHLPPGSAIPVRFHVDRYITLSPALIDVTGAYFRDPSPARIAEIRRLGAVESGCSIKESRDDVFLVPEFFDRAQKVAFFRSMSESELRRYRFIVCDLLPLTHPEYFLPQHKPLVLSEYFRIIRRAGCCGFISAYTRDIFYNRLKRTESGGSVVLPLGCDSLGPRPAQASLDRPLTFTVLGTVEPRKNHALILEAFEPLLRQVEGLALVFLGHLGWVDSAFTDKVQMLAANKCSGFQFHATPDDETIWRYVQQSRATVYVSLAEGYGLPPVESLWCGTPVIASSAIPSLNMLGSAGIEYVEPLNVVNLRRAVLRFVDNGYANHKAEEALQLSLPTWQSFTREVLRWCGEN